MITKEEILQNKPDTFPRAILAFAYEPPGSVDARTCDCRPRGYSHLERLRPATAASARRGADQRTTASRRRAADTCGNDSESGCGANQRDTSGESRTAGARRNDGQSRRGPDQRSAAVCRQAARIYGYDGESCRGGYR
jgi:hypothetical protein